MDNRSTVERPRSRRYWTKGALVVALSLLMLGGVVDPRSLTPVADAAGGPTLYVDGKTGNDANTGLEPTKALKTIAKAAALLPAGSASAGWTVSVQGYTDYVYRERPIPPGWNRRGTPTAPITFQATGYGSGSSASYVKPIVSGADVAPALGQTWSASGIPDVWRTPWAQTPFGFGGPSSGTQIALFQNTTSWLWQQSSLTALADRAKLGKGGFWYDTAARTLYVSALGPTSSGGTNPAKYKIDVVMRNAFLFMGTEGVAHVGVRGFSVRHSANGIAFIKGADYGTVADNVVTGNLMMGIQTSGGQTPSGPDPAIGHVVARNTGSYNTIQMIKVDEGTQNSSFCDNTATRNALQGIKVQGPPGNTSYTGTTSGITICRNTLASNDYNPTGSVYNNASGVTIANGAQQVMVESNKVYSNDVGIHVTQESVGRAPLDKVALRRNDVHDNRRFGLNLYDGAPGGDAGKGLLLSEYDIYWRNGVGVIAARGTANKTISHATIYDNVAEGIKVGEAGQSSADLVVTASIVTANKGWGLWLVTGNTSSLSHVNLSSNVLGAVKGAPTTDAVNTYPAGLVSTDPAGSSFLKVSADSYQYTAGPSATPLGAR
jgi:hypothetical protein